MTKKIFQLVALSLFVLLINLPLNILAEVPSFSGKVTGIIMDAETNSPLEFATVSVYTVDSSLVQGTITSKSGTFDIPLAEGSYYAEIQFIGYQTKRIQFTIEKRTKQVNLKNIILEQEAKSLSGVTITREKSEMTFSLDKKVFNVGKDLTNAGKTAVDILDNIPTVTVDVDGNVSLRGSQGVKILIDGKPSGLLSNGEASSLRSLQGNMIDRVEVITNPSVRYQAEGMSGIINIILKKDERKGINGSFEATVGTPENYALGANLNIRREKVNYFFNYGVNYRESPGKGGSTQKFFPGDTTYFTEVDRSRLRSGWSHNLRGGADFFINDLNTLTASVLVGLEDNNNKTDVWYRDFNENHEISKVSYRNDNELENETNLEFALNYEKRFKGSNDKKFTALFQIFKDQEGENSSISEKLASLTGELPLTGDNLLQRSSNGENEQNALLQADYVLPFSGNGKFETGYRGNIRTIHNPYLVEEKNDLGQWNALPEFNNTFDYTENIQAMYALVGKEFGLFSVQGGLRAEYSLVNTHLITTDEKNERDYLDVFPSLHTTFKLNENNSLQASYSRRIQRPNFSSLNPFHSFSDARNIRMGNPNLEPEYTSSFDGGYLLTKGKTSLYAGAFFRNTTNVIERVSYVDTTSSIITYTTPQNLSEKQSYGFESNLSLPIFKWWDISGNINVYKSKTDAGNAFIVQDLITKTFSWNTRVNSRMRFKNNFDIQAVFFYRGPEEHPQSKIKAFSMFDLAFSKDIFKNNGTLTLNIRDVFNNRVFRYTAFGENFTSENNFRWSTRSINLSFIYRLNQKKKPGTNRGQGSESGGGDMDF